MVAYQRRRFQWVVQDEGLGYYATPIAHVLQQQMPTEGQRINENGDERRNADSPEHFGVSMSKWISMGIILLHQAKTPEKSDSKPETPQLCFRKGGQGCEGRRCYLRLQEAGQAASPV